MHPVEKALGDKFPKYTKYLNLAHMLATSADLYAMQADGLLMDSTQYTLNNKNSFKTLKRTLSVLLKQVDNMEAEENTINSFHAASNFLYNLADVLGDKILTPDDEIKIISMIKNYK